MADSVVPCSLGPSALASSTYRDSAGTKQTRALKRGGASRRQAELEAAARRKAEFERKAVHIVEQLLEENITEEFLKECGALITPAHYSDVVEERAIIRLCGYPLCPKKLGAIPKQKYKISTKTNKVYDITERKSFCSNFCYRASKFFETQIPKTPVWVREEERPPDFELLKKGQSGRSGEEVQFFREAMTVADLDGPGASPSSDDDEEGFVSSLLPGGPPRAAPPAAAVREEAAARPESAESGAAGAAASGLEELAERLRACRVGAREEAAAETPPPAPPGPSAREGGHGVAGVTLVGLSRRSAELFRSRFARGNRGSAEAPPAGAEGRPEAAKASLLRVLKDTLTEWKTEETLSFLRSQDCASVSLRPSPTCGPDGEADEADGDDEDDLSRSGPALSPPQSNLHETLPVRGSQTAVQPLPSYESLKKETELLNLRVREFYRGGYLLGEDAAKAQDPAEKVFPRDLSFPLIDSSSQNQIRKRIVLEKLSKVLPGLLGPLQITMGDIYTELKNLVQTFRLSNRNIIHKPVEWTLIAVVLLSLLTPMLGIQKHSPKNVLFTQFIATLLTELHLKCEDLENLTTIFRTSC
ncbi:putative RNA polymerase II subunit B1 CTD phosphatase RPAP2 isoform X1 [Meriones unguiculatus]|uniref:putative RNA polymerase II subunit B1 CTD phosphatase RPAP2 isoform X1 n=2 Tax=Meriones unguiculatus TaxID=10047 RepID=UPI00293F32F3|nr:putative RNA polymerase II subunit B1 CTD phosphatase RPAP2 isoform X1 [Meriones unguiculatus]